MSERRAEGAFALPDLPDLLAAHDARMRGAAEHAEAAATGAGLMLRAASRQAGSIAASHHARATAAMDRARAAAPKPADGPAPVVDALHAYLRDAAERAVLTLDILRERGDVVSAHEAADCPPVLAYAFERIMDGADLPRPCNYELLRILPPEGVEIIAARRPYIIIDPRAGHGPGIGGFKTDSQVGVALAEGRAVYFVSFRRRPEPGQTIADVARAEAAFVREVMRRHPDSSAPAIIGNCQGGWATLVLAATNPDLTGPVVLNGAPVAPWAGLVGENPMRYNGGVLGGTWVPMLRADLGGGIFDGADLVQNFELLNPARSWFRKYYDLFADPDGQRARFLEFERWWGGFFLMNGEEIRWIVEELFVGNRLSRNIAQLEPGLPIDIKSVQAPVIVFASHGDNITPPQQALNWILDAYGDEEEIRIRGQRILYMVHEDVGHLGIFVSSSIARKEHAQMATTMKTIEALAPGLYEMKIDETSGEGLEKRFLVSFHERKLTDIEALDDGREDEAPFAAVARASELQAELYDLTLRPVIRALVTPEIGEKLRERHPMRASRAALSSRNPALTGAAALAGAVRGRREGRAAAGEAPVTPANNPWRAAETLAADAVEQWMDFGRDLRDAAYEWTFYAMWSTLWARAFGAGHAPRRPLLSHEELRALPVVQAALQRIRQGGFEEAVIRMLVLLADSRGSVRRDRLERSSRVLTRDAPFRDLDMDRRARIIHEQTLVATFAPEDAVATLPDLLPDRAARELAAATVQYVPGPIAEMAPHTREAIDGFRAALGLPPAQEDVTEDPLAAAGDPPAPEGD
ncbi:DUF3141 domain-containing protein [Rhodovulum sp. DZ06]|uniref:DUF3141 domain-containing protein n=1 Tax=Rhodovulum sp. DZ06 TaxID=3425126 RepID=UPI003D32C39F